jgi:hypothetical protein
MTTQNDGWIKMSERKPTMNDLPVWGINAENGKLPFLCTHDNWSDMMPGQNNRYSGFNNWATHWQPATIPAPPKKELTQREKDEEAFIHWESGSHRVDDDPRYAWHAALAYRDQQNAEDLEAVGFPLMHTDKHGPFAALRRRCGLDS